MRSLTSRLSWGLTGSLVILLFIQFAVVTSALNGLTEDRVADRLVHDAEGVLVALTATPAATTPHGPSLALDASRVDPLFRQPFSGHYFVIHSGATVIRSRSLWDHPLALPNPPTVGRSHLVGPQGQQLLAVTGRYTRFGQPLLVTTTEDMGPLHQVTDRLQVRYGLMWLFSLVVLILVQRWIARTSLRPLAGVRADVAALEQGQVSSLRETVPREIHPLVVEFNRLLAVFAGRIHRSRTALGNLAHAVKTPLTLLTQLADRPELADQPEIRATITRETDTILTLMERELKRARMAGAAQPGQHIDLSSELQRLADALLKVHREKGLDIRLDLPPHSDFPGDREDMLELFGNLMDNACKWARFQVWVRAERCDDTLVVTVSDDGPGCPQEQRAQLTTRGLRADESAPGHGLGLAIAQEVAEGYGGSLSVGESSELGGFQVQVTLPVRATYADA